MTEPLEPTDGPGGSVTGGAQALEWSVGTVAEHLGIATPTLRTWDRRYGIGPSRRTTGGHRRYGDDDVLRVQVMMRFTARGVPAQTAARVALAMEPDQLREQVGESGSEGIESVLAVGRARAPVEPPRSSGEQIEAITEAAAALDGAALGGLYRTVMREHDLISGWTHVLAPALRRIGEEWGAGRLGVESEHLASELLVGELRMVVRSQRRHTAGAPSVVLASADEDQHYLPLLALEAELARHGVDTTFLGARVPAVSLGDAISRTRPRSVFLWASLARPAADPIWQHLADTAQDVCVVTGGPGWPPVAPVGESPRVRVEHARDLADAVQLLVRAGASG